MKKRFLGTSGFHLTDGISGVLIDPFDKTSGEIDGGVVYCTHNHPDHTGGISVFMNRNPEAVLLTNEEVAASFKQYSDRTVIATDGGSYETENWEFQFVELRHGFLGALNIGVVVRNEGNSFCHVGDAVTYEGVNSLQLDSIAVPITGTFTTSPNQAIAELKKFSHLPSNIVAMHWFYRNPKAFCRKLTEEIPNARCIIPAKGQVIPSRR